MSINTMDSRNMTNNKSQSFVRSPHRDSGPAANPDGSIPSPRERVRLTLQKLVYAKHPFMQPTEALQWAACIERLIHRHHTIQRLEDCDDQSNLNDCLKLLITSLIEKDNARNGVAHSMSLRRKVLKSKLGCERYVKALALCREFYLCRFNQAKRMSCARCEESTCDMNAFRTTNVFSNPSLLQAIENMPLHDVSLTCSDQWDLWIQEMEEIVAKR